MVFLHEYFSFFRFRALYNYKPQNDDEVELNEGDVVYVMERCDDGKYIFFYKVFKMGGLKEEVQIVYRG